MEKAGSVARWIAVPARVVAITFLFTLLSFAVGLLLRSPPGGTAPSTSGNAPTTNADSDLVAAVKKAVATVSAGVTVGKKNANINIGVTGLTANLKRDDSGASIGVSWGGTLKMEANSGPFHFSGSLSKDSWEIVLSYPQDTYIPDLSTVGKVFTEGETAVRKIAEATREFNNVSDVGKVGALVKPQVDKVQKAVEAANGVAKAKGGVSFGFKIGSPEPGPGDQGMPRGVQGTIVFSYVF